MNSFKIAHIPQNSPGSYEVFDFEGQSYIQTFIFYNPQFKLYKPFLSSNHKEIASYNFSLSMF